MLLGVVLVTGGCVDEAQGGARDGTQGGAATADTAPVRDAGPAREMTTTDGEVFVPEGPSPEQESALVDGVVTREEYESGFRRFESCMAALGIELADVDMGATVLSTSYKAQGTVDEENCYYTEYHQVDLAWQMENYDYSADIAALVACLKAAGVTPDRDAAAKSVRQYEALEAQRAEEGVAEAACLPAPPS